MVNTLYPTIIINEIVAKEEDLNRLKNDLKTGKITSFSYFYNKPQNTIFITII